MATQYLCDHHRRRQALREHPTLNGIDFLEVLDQDAPPGSPRQQTLLVRTVKPLPPAIDARNVEIEGGVRVTPIRVSWAGRAADAAALLAAGRINPAERDLLLAQPTPDALLVVRVDEPGDFSKYTLRLVRSSTDERPPPDFDPLLSELHFAFKVECPSDWDCAVEPDCPPEEESPPAIDYLAKDYASFRQLILDRLAVTMPDWTERNPADVGIVLVELLAYAADQLSYYQDAAATEAYLDTARLRSSVRRHARLLDYPMHEGCNARAWVAFEVDAGGDGARLPRRDPVSGRPTALLTRIPAAPRLREHQLEPMLDAHAPLVFELMSPLTLYAAHNRIDLYTWGDDDCCLPRGATRATLRDDAAARLRLRAGDVLIFEEMIDPGTGQAADADPTRRHAVRLTSVTPEASEDLDGARTPGAIATDPLFDQPVVEIEWAAEDALPFPLCISATAPDGRALENVSVARGNVALADHGRTIPGESLPPPGGHLRYRPALGEQRITYREVEPPPPTRPATEVLEQAPRQALPAITLDDGERTWRPRADLLASARFATEFVAEVESDGRTRLRFGDDIFGRAPGQTTRFEARYRVGSGLEGNVGAEAIAHVVTGIRGITRVRNPLPAAGGLAPEPLERVRLDAPEAFRIQARAVTEADYAEVAERHPAVQRAVASRRWTGSWYTMFLTVDRVGGLPVDADFERELRGFLERFRLAGHDLEIDAPRFVALEIAMGVCVEEGYFRADVERALLERLSSGRRAGGRRGFFHPDNFSFGEPLYLSRLLAEVMREPGVRWVALSDEPGSPHRFQRWGELARGEIAAGQITTGRLEIVRLDNDPNRPENGRLRLLMEGGR